MGQAADAFKEIIPQVLGWGLLAVGLSFIGFGIYNDLNWGLPGVTPIWACPGIFYEATNALECLTDYTLLVEIPWGVGLLVVGIIILIIDKMYLSKE